MPYSVTDRICRPRIRRPMIKVDGSWQEVSWDAAFRRCTELLTPVIRGDGRPMAKEPVVAPDVRRLVGGQVVAEWPPGQVSAVTGIDEDRIRQLARELAGTEKSVVYGRIGLCNQGVWQLAS
jgi:anaerobic selenocysteine-containing dehydrogenase